jgi:hypothetical protein
MRTSQPGCLTVLMVAAAIDSHILYYLLDLGGCTDRKTSCLSVNRGMRLKLYSRSDR